MLFLKICALVILNSIRVVPSTCAPRTNHWQTKRDPFTNYRKYVRDLTEIEQTTKFSVYNKSSSEKAPLPILEETKRYDSTIIFPDSEEDDFDTFPKISVEPKCADGSTFCEEIDTYPVNYLKRVLSTDDKHTDLFGVDESPIEHRIGENADHFICESIEMTIFPKVAKNKNKKWRYIINQGEQDKYVQGVRIEKCLRPNGPCNLLGGSTYGYYTSCKQKFIYRRLLSLSDVGRPVVDQFQIPSACCCAYKKDLGHLVTFGTHFRPAQEHP